jgi:hypothetical protein
MREDAPIAGYGLVGAGFTGKHKLEAERVRIPDTSVI